MKKIILLLMFCFSITIISAQDIWYTLDGDSLIEKMPRRIHTSGDYLVNAGTYNLIGVGLSLAGTAVVLGGCDFEKGNYKRNNVIGGSAISLAGIIFSIVGHGTLIKAGKLMNENRNISFHPSSDGIGLALKF